MTVNVAYREDGRDMVPVERSGRLALFPTLEQARQAAGPLGVASPVRWSRVVELCQRNGLKLPARPEPDDDVRQLALFAAGGES